MTERGATKKGRGILIFLAAFLLSAATLSLLWKDVTSVLDGQMWASQAEYVLEGDSRQFDYLKAYGHPGGPLIESTIAISQLTQKAYKESFIIAFILLNAFVIALCAVVAESIYPRSMWWVGVVGVLATNRLYEGTTPPSILAGVLLTLVVFLSIRLYAKTDPHVVDYIAWGSALGALGATRADYGALGGLAFGTLLLIRFGWRKAIVPIAVTVASFIALNPFMWFMPLQHIQDLVFKFTFHYAVYQPVQLSVMAIFAWCGLAFVSIAFGVLQCVFQKRAGGIIPLPVMVTLILMTMTLFGVVLTSDYQAERYFTPMLLIWEALLALFLLTATEKMEFSFVHNEEGRQRVAQVLRVVIILLVTLSSGFVLASSLGYKLTHILGSI